MITLRQQEKLKARILRESDIVHYKHGAVVLSKAGTILSVGVNVRGRGYSSRFSYHAEEMALIRCLRSSGHNKPYALWVGRLDKDGRWGPSAPCVRCRDIIQKAGISKVYHT